MAEPTTLAEFLEAELQKKLATLTSDHARFTVLSDQYRAWEVRRAMFFVTNGDSEICRAHPRFGHMTATDFLFVLMMIEAEQTKLQREAA